ncbi:MAG: dolichyl-phosphate beta-glucosyltransferase [Candidatus Dormibacteria bacterium]
MSTPPPDLSLVVPAFNEARRLPPSLERIRQHLDETWPRHEVLVVDDFSQDRTVAVVEAAARGWPELRLLRLPRHLGKGGAVKAGMLEARGRLRLFSDADLSTPVEEMAKLVAAIEGGAAVAIGSRALPESRVELHQPRHRELMGKAYNQVLRRLVLPGIHDSQCGFKLFTAEAAQVCFEPLRCLDFGFDAEVLRRARDHGLSIAEVPVVWRNALGTTVSSLGDGGQMLVDLVRLRRELGPPRSRNGHR